MKKNISWLAIANLVFGFSQWLIVIVLNRTFGLEAAGVYSLALGITAPIFTFLNMNLNSIYITGNSRGYTFSTFYLFRLFTSLIAFSIVTSIILTSDYSLDSVILILIISGIKLVEGQSSFIYAKFQEQEILYLAAKSKIIRSVIIIITLILVSMLTSNIIIMFSILLFMYFFILVLDHRLLLKNTNEKLHFFDKGKIVMNKSIFLFIFFNGFPLALAAFFDSSSINVQRLIIEENAGLISLGIYSSITFLMTTGQTIINAISQVILPRLMREYRENKTAFINILKKILSLTVIGGMLVVFGVYLLGDYVLVFLYGEDFAGTNYLFSLIMIGATVWYVSSFLNTAIISTGNYKLQLIPYLVSFLSSFFFTSLLIKKFNLYGVAFALILMMVTRVIMMLIILKWILDKKAVDKIKPRN